MKKFLIWMLMLAMLIPCATGEPEYDSVINSAIDALKEFWSAEVYGGFAPEENDGHLEIKNTRIVVIRDEPKAGAESGETGQKTAEECFGNAAYIVEFMLYSDCLGTAPYYQAAGSWNSVVVCKDGTMYVPAEDPFQTYRSRTYSFDISGIVADVVDFNQQYNAVYRLPEK